MIEAHMRWILIGSEEAIGKQALESVLNENGLTKYINNYPAGTMSLNPNITIGDYANISAGLIEFYQKTGNQGIASEMIRLGRNCTKPALEYQGILFNFAARTAIRLLPLSLQVKTVLEGIQGDLDKIYKAIDHEVNVEVVDRGQTWAYIDEGCALCAGKEADAPICWSWVGTLEESLQWMTGKQFAIEQVKCRAMGDSNCVWEISKKAKRSFT